MSNHPRGTFCIVLHSHLPWVAHHGRWPVGEEWLHQAWAQSYAPLVEMLARLADRGHDQVLTLGVTPVLSAALDDPYCIAEHHRWLADWMLRADGLAAAADPTLRRHGEYESAQARRALDRFDSWGAGGSPLWRGLADAGVVEVLGGPATHPVLPLVSDPVAHLALGAGLDDHTRRLGRRPAGLWLPECAYAPGLEHLLSQHAVGHLMLDGPSLRHVGASTDEAWSLGDSDVAVVGRDLDVTYRVWSPRRGYPGGRWYRDFHTYHHASGFKTSRVTGASVPPEAKAPYDPDAASAAIQADVDDFVDTLLRRFASIEDETGREGLVVAGYDTELFGHWWHEGVHWLETLVHRLADTPGVTLATLAGALTRHPPAKPVYPERSSWGLGKGLDVWDGAAVTDMLEGQRWAQDALIAAVAPRDAHVGRDVWADALAEEVLLACASDWPFMVSHQSSPDYARSRLNEALAAVDRRLRHRSIDGDEPALRPFGGVDARLLRGA